MLQPGAFLPLNAPPSPPERHPRKSRERPLRTLLFFCQLIRYNSSNELKAKILDAEPSVSTGVVASLVCHPIARARQNAVVRGRRCPPDPRRRGLARPSLLGHQRR